ncbi:hypothetical protein ACQ4LE_001103 [Meloidogyne hapla]
MFHSINTKPIHIGDRSSVYIAKQGSEFFALKVSPEIAWKNEMKVYQSLQNNKFNRIQYVISSGEIPEGFKVHNKLHKFYILTRYNNLRDVNAWLGRIPGITEAMRFKAARETLLALKELHLLGFVSRDVKLENFGVHITKDHRLNFCIYDLELSQKYIDIETRELTVRKPIKGHGTTEYAPLVQMNGSRPTFPVDDVEGWFYCLYHIFCNSVPWNRYTPEPEFNISNEKYSEKYLWIRGAKREMQRTGKIYCAKKYDCLMSAIFKVILKWLKTPELVEVRFYDEICSILKRGMNICGRDELNDCNNHCRKHYNNHRHDA